ncbi:Rieske (2Fe-2S) protein [Flavobacterium sp.]|uniref:Rieske (2Fe-2S) protein n=1 Tax=Flavobacterium sp. TaxID=239 RepID=UPI003D6A4A0C
MKKYLFLVVALIALSCSKDRIANSNPYLQNVGFSKEINTNLPSYNGLQFPSNPILITDPDAGIKGIIVMKVGTNDYRAYEASCPNQYPSDCSRMTLDGINAKCPCENYEYSLFTGVGSAQYPLKAYRVEANSDGSVIRVYN